MIEPEEHLTKREKDYLIKIRDSFPHDWFSEPDADLLNAYVCSKYRALDMEKKMRKQGPTIIGARGSVVSNPLARMLNAEHKKMTSLATKLRITKSATKNPNSIAPAKQKQADGKVPAQISEPVKKKRAYTVMVNGKRARRIPSDNPAVKIYNYVTPPLGKPPESEISDVMVRGDNIFETNWTISDDRSEMAKGWRKNIIMKQ